MSKQNKFERDKDELKRRVDCLIDAYERPGVRSGGTCIQVECFKEDLFFAMEAPDGRMHYRGRILIPVARRKEKAREAPQQADIEQARVKFE